jgi:uncharacterized zinc-type alcohol dehydrogenase-like protein
MEFPPLSYLKRKVVVVPTKGYETPAAKETLQPFSFERRNVGAHDLLIRITLCGICHSEIHQARDEWCGSISPMAPSYEIVGLTTKGGMWSTSFA